MNEEELTEDEKVVVAQLLSRKPSARDMFSDYAMFVVPSLAFAIYSIWAHDFVAALVAYGSLLFVAVWYLWHSQRVSGSLYTALRKYENVSNKLGTGNELNK